MVETLTVWVVILSLFVIVLGAITAYVWLSAPEGDCKHCGGSGQTVVPGTNGNVQVRCPFCSE